MSFVIAKVVTNPNIKAPSTRYKEAKMIVKTSPLVNEGFCKSVVCSKHSPKRERVHKKKIVLFNANCFLSFSMKMMLWLIMFMKPLCTGSDRMTVFRWSKLMVSLQEVWTKQVHKKKV